MTLIITGYKKARHTGKTGHATPERAQMPILYC